MTDKENPVFDAEKVAAEIKKTDWYFDFSDSIYTTKRGREHQEKTQALLRTLTKEQLKEVFEIIRDDLRILTNNDERLIYDPHFYGAYGKEFFVDFAKAKKVSTYSGEKVYYLTKERFSLELCVAFLDKSAKTCFKIDYDRKFVVRSYPNSRTDAFDSAVVDYLVEKHDFRFFPSPEKYEEQLKKEVTKTTL